MPEKRFSLPLRIELPTGTTTVTTVEEARDILMEDWPEAARGPRHRDALETCLKVLDGHRSIVDAESALSEAAREAGFWPHGQPQELSR